MPDVPSRPRATLQLLRVGPTVIDVHVSLVALLVLTAWTLATDTLPAHLGPTMYTPAQYWMLGAAGAVSLLLAVVLHELAHLAVIARAGRRIPRVTLFIFGGYSPQADDLPTPGKELAAALSGLLLTGALAGLSWWGEHQLVDVRWVGPILRSFAIANTLLACAHLIPSFPMDGGRAVSALMWQWTGDAHAGARLAAQLGGVFALVLGTASAVGAASQGMLSIWGMGMLLAIALWLLSTGRSRLARLRERLQGLLVADLMERPPPPLPRIMSVADALVGRLTDGRRHGAWLVEWQQRLGGIVTLSELRAVPEDERLQTPVGQVMRRLEHEHVVGPRTRLESALRRMAYSRLPFLPVVHAGSLVGILRRERVDRVIRGESAGTVSASAS